MSDDVVITSAQNPRVRLVRRLAGSRSARDREGAFVVEGEDLVVAALRAGLIPRFILVDAERPASWPGDIAEFGHDVVSECAPEIMAAAADLAHPPRVIAVFDAWTSPIPDPSAAGVRLVLNAVHDPGNVGTAIRSAAAFGAAAVGLTSGSADAYAPKTLRAAMGTTFLQPVVKVPAPDCFPGCGPVIILDGRGSVPLPELRGAIAEWASSHPHASSISSASPILVIGSERNGVHESFMNIADLIVRIPQAAAVESINAGVAATLALYELARG